MQFGKSDAQADLGLELVDAGGFEVVLSLEDEAAGGEAGVEAGLLELVLFVAQLGGFAGDFYGGDIGLHGAHGGADVNQQGLIELLEAGLLLEKAGFSAAVAGFIRVEAPGDGEGKADVPVVAVTFGEVADGVAVGALGGGVADAGVEVEAGEGGLFGAAGVDLELFDLGLSGEEVGGALTGVFVNAVEGRRAFVVVAEFYFAGAGVEIKLADEGEERVFAVADGLFGLEGGAAGVGDADFGGEDIEIGGDAGGFADFVFFEKFGGELEAALFHDEIFASVSEIVVGVFGVADDGEDLALVVKQRDADAEFVALDVGAGDGRAGAFEERLAEGYAGAAAESWVEGGVKRVGGSAGAVAGHADGAAGGDLFTDTDGERGVIAAGAAGGGAVEPAGGGGGLVEVALGRRGEAGVEIRVGGVERFFRDFG